eukprot:TRINITY_DN11195_c0_g1_i1.p1 TRINITY_DN11195_c0_g1~~TRINITY_DN11195_c0_g1_i1.p1  ORF type:complete len:126 (+),score=9.66 TRINITY_DN11195_c0_g1_i1:47-424(+)
MKPLKRVKPYLAIVSDVFQRFNRCSLDLFAKHMRALWKLVSIKEDTEVLPISNISYKKTDASLSNLELENRFSVDTRSGFVAIAGHNAVFKDLRQLLNTTPHWIDFIRGLCLGVSFLTHMEKIWC